MSNSKFMAFFNKLNSAKTQGELQAFLNELEPQISQVDPNLHHKSQFNAKTLNLDYTFKRLLMGCAINDQTIQKKFIAATYYVLQRHNQEVDLKMILRWVEENVSYKAAINKSEKAHFEFANFCIKTQILMISTDDTLHKKVKDSIIDAIGRRESSKLLACAVVKYTDDVSFLAQLVDFKPQHSFPEFSLHLAVYARLKVLGSKDATSTVKRLNEQISKLLKIKYLCKVLDDMTNTLQSHTEADQPFYSFLATFIWDHAKFAGKFIEELEGLCKQSDQAKYSVKFATHALLLMNALINHSAESNKLPDHTIRAVLVAVDQLKSKNQVVHGFSKHFLDKFVQEMGTRKPELLKNLLTKLFDLYESDHGCVEHKLLNAIYRNLSTAKESGSDFMANILKRLNTSIEQGELTHFKFYTAEFATAVVNIKSADEKVQQYENLINLYANFKDIANSFTEKAELSLKKTISVGLSLLYDKITEAVFKESEVDVLRQLANIWASNSEELQEIADAGAAVKEETLARLIFCTVFVNFAVETLDPQSMTLKQTGDDLLNFSQKFNENAAQSEDVQILIDCLIALLNIPNQNLRKTCGEVTKLFVKQLDEESFGLIETELFEQPMNELLDEEDDEGEDIILEGALL